MSIHAHKTGLNKTLGQQSDGIVTTDLTGNFIPTAGIETLYWDNQVSSGLNLRRFNGITHNNSTPHNFQFDGTDDYLGAASTGYGGSAFTVNAAAAFTLCQWVKYNNVTHFAFVSDDGEGLEYITLDLNSSSEHKASVSVLSSTYGAYDTTTFNFTFADDTWYYIALTHDGAGNYKFYVNGSFVGSSAIGRCDNSGALEIGKSGSSASGAGTKIGHVHVYTAAITNSQVRQNFLATHDINNTRVYGATYTA
jgi:hypothetical protein